MEYKLVGQCEEFGVLNENLMSHEELVFGSGLWEKIVIKVFM